MILRHLVLILTWPFLLGDWIRCRIGRHTFPMMAKKFIQWNPDCDFDGEVAFAGYEAQCYVCGKVIREAKTYSIIDFHCVEMEKNVSMMKAEYRDWPDHKLTEELHVF